MKLEIADRQMGSRRTHEPATHAKPATQAKPVTHAKPATHAKPVTHAKRATQVEPGTQVPGPRVSSHATQIANLVWASGLPMLFVLVLARRLLS